MEQDRFLEGCAHRFTHDQSWRACSNSPVDLDLYTILPRSQAPSQVFIGESLLHGSSCAPFQNEISEVSLIVNMFNKLHDMYYALHITVTPPPPPPPPPIHDCGKLPGTFALAVLSPSSHYEVLSILDVMHVRKHTRPYAFFMQPKAVRAWDTPAFPLLCLHYQTSLIATYHCSPIRVTTYLASFTGLLTPSLVPRPPPRFYLVRGC